jgi:hypothetical protein
VAHAPEASAVRRRAVTWVPAEEHPARAPTDGRGLAAVPQRYAPGQRQVATCVPGPLAGHLVRRRADDDLRSDGRQRSLARPPWPASGPRALAAARTAATALSVIARHQAVEAVLLGVPDALTNGETRRMLADEGRLRVGPHTRRRGCTKRREFGTGLVQRRPQPARHSPRTQARPPQTHHRSSCVERTPP